jgi:hypothetical protein
VGHPRPVTGLLYLHEYIIFQLFGDKERILDLHKDEKPPNCIAEKCGLGFSIVKLNLLPEFLNF